MWQPGLGRWEDIAGNKRVGTGRRGSCFRIVLESPPVSLYCMQWDVSQGLLSSSCFQFWTVYLWGPPLLSSLIPHQAASLLLGQLRMVLFVLSHQPKSQSVKAGLMEQNTIESLRAIAGPLKRGSCINAGTRTTHRSRRPHHDSIFTVFIKHRNT